MALIIQPGSIPSGERFGVTEVPEAAVAYAVNSGSAIYGVKSAWQRITLRNNPDGTLAFSPWAINTWRIAKLGMTEFLSLRSLQGTTLTSLDTNNIYARNTLVSYSDAILESAVQAGHEGLNAIGVDLRFRVKVD